MLKCTENHQCTKQFQATYNKELHMIPQWIKNSMAKLEKKDDKLSPSKESEVSINFKQNYLKIYLIRI